MNVKTLSMEKVHYDEFKTMVMVTEWEEFGQNVGPLVVFEFFVIILCLMCYLIMLRI